MLGMSLIKGRREASLITPYPVPLLKEGGTSYEAHQTVVDHDSSYPVGGMRGGSGGGGRLRRGAKLGRRAWRVHPEGRKRRRSRRHDRGEGSSPRGRDNHQERDKAARRRRRRDRSARQGGLALLEVWWTGGYLRPRRLQPRKRQAHRPARERC